MHRRTLIQSAVCALLAAAAPARAAFPDKPIKLVTPFPPGGTVGNIAHALSLKLAALLGQPVVIEPRPGAAGALSLARSRIRVRVRTRVVMIDIMIIDNY